LISVVEAAKVLQYLFGHQVSHHCSKSMLVGSHEKYKGKI
jgi:hypothetical protein